MPPKLRNLQALRGVAILMVILFHLADWELKLARDPTYLFLRPVAYFGFAGVDLFFVISGFIITWVHHNKLGRPSALGDYVLKRFVRIYPSYWVCLAGSVIVIQFILKLNFRIPSAGEGALWLLLAPDVRPNSFVIQAWSLSYEVFYYLVFATFFVLPRLCFVPTLAIWFAATAWVRFVARPTLGLYAAIATEPFVLEFLLGCFAAAALRYGIRVGARSCTLLGTCGFVIGASLNYAGVALSAEYTGPRFLLFGVSAALLVYGLTAHELAGGRPLPQWLQSLGNVSYSLYLWHLTAFNVVLIRTRRLTHTPGPHLLWLGLMFGTAIAVGYLAFYYVERPLLNYLQQRRAKETEIERPAELSEHRAAA